MNIDNKFNIGQVVYLIHDAEQSPKLVTCIKITPNGLLYEVAFGSETLECYDMELTETKDVLLACGVEQPKN